MGKQSLRIRTFADAVDVVFGLHKRYRHAHVAILLDGTGRVRDLTPFRESHNTIDTALDWAHCMICNDERIKRIVLLSVGQRDVRNLLEADLERFRLARDVFGGWGIDILDWIQSDGEWTCSLAFTTGTASWPDAGHPFTKAVHPSQT